ncbi:hypothetical protein NFI96_009825, partial [Prochilodus magdalenae]
MSVKFLKLSYDPCYNYDVLDDPQRATNQTNPWGWGWWCDANMKWNGWYRLLYEGNNIRMPESCVSEGMCSTDVPLWLNGSHPQLEDGVITRQMLILHYSSYDPEIPGTTDSMTTTSTA